MNGHELGFCSSCQSHYRLPKSGGFRDCGILCSLGLLAAKTRPDLAAILFLTSLIFGDTVERWITARCPACGLLLRIATQTA